MLNKTGIVKHTGAAPVQILFNVQNQMAVSILVDEDTTGYETINGRKIVRAGSPLTGSLENRGTPFSQATLEGSTKGVFTLQITTAFAADEKLTIEGVDYTCAAAEDVAGKKFAGANAAAQVTSLLKMVTTSKYDVAAVTGATDKLGFTQKVADGSDTTGPTVSKTSTTGTIGSVTKVTDPVSGTSNAVGILLHDTDITDGDANASLLIWGFVNLDRVPDAAKVQLTDAVKTALAGHVTFLKDN